MDMERKITISDTGFVVALLNQSDIKHSDVVAIYQNYQQILLPQTVLAEVAYLVGRSAGVSTVAAFLKGLSASRFHLIPLSETDVIRVSEILEEYKDSRIDFVDATVMAIAERLKITLILTLDQRDFRLFRPKHCQSLEILP
ncbi:MAG: PIN domain-containing protein [Microcystis sp. M048S1]|jgi:predicted nucleic acid-binding protein|uniref:PIN domain-containing protein n=6 Tax=Microcystaceae TaxID=1890449 RepID=I4HW46_MICAE|nr:PIN domain-containing protein [Microcystis aeruginosa]MBE9074490.1 PIN domain-containing protein [Microcystis sp. LEGE 08355]MCA2628419.1 PIN domain-containing protein [Microcystis sp. M091S2]MCA2648377.1 PIN domain-containing protein [Microcystis sp. M069S2]MCA2662676.1 PIN domain-containing protein [Microcystis sp. M064S2]MCA2676192.1 PIN domain-containing protein [Microcystis sp. M054S2]MCA2699742.1 PIN domain-containing protein [Microcystis sp. M179S2]MCA2721561.1 PIN domain-containin